MKRIINLLTTCALAFPVFMAVGCSGNSGEEEPVGNEVSLEASKTSVVANGNDQVTFTVKRIYQQYRGVQSQKRLLRL